MSPILAVASVTKQYRSRRPVRERPAPGVADVGFTVEPGEIVGLVGESGCGKTTTARLVVGLLRPDSGRVLIDGVDVHTATGPQLRTVRRTAKMIFQNPYESLNPRMSIGTIAAEGLVVHKLAENREQRRELVLAAMADVGLPAALFNRRPADLSGGQRQRVAIARALAVRPRLLVCDEIVSALDVSVQAQVCNLLLRLRDEYGLSILFIAHDLAVVRNLCDTVAVMDEGRIIETGSTDNLFRDPQHPITIELLAATPIPDPARADRGVAVARPAEVAP